MKHIMNPNILQLFGAAANACVGAASTQSWSLLPDMTASQRSPACSVFAFFVSMGCVDTGTALFLQAVCLEAGASTQHPVSDMYICVFVYMYIWIYGNISIQVYMNLLCVYSVCVYIYICKYVCMHVCMCVYVYVYVYVCVCVCVCICVCMYIYILK